MDDLFNIFSPPPAPGSQVGIGLKLNSKLEVQEVVAGGPSQASGMIEPGDILLAIDGESVVGKKPAELGPLILGPDGSTIDLLIRKASDQTKVPVKLFRGKQASGGIGMKLQRNDRTQLAVLELMPGGPAEKAGVLIGDIVEKINGQNVIGLTVREAVPLVAGPAGTKLKVSIVRGSKREKLQFEITREVPTKSVADAKAQQKAEQEQVAKKKQEEEEETKRKEEEEKEKKRREEEEAKEKRRREEEEAKRVSIEAAEAKRKAEEETEARKRAEAEAEAQKKRAEEEETKRKALEEELAAAKRQVEEGKRQAEEEKRKAKAEEEAARKAEEEKKKAEAKRKEEEEKEEKKRQEEEKKKKKEEERKRKEEEEAKKKEEQEQAAKAKEEEEEAKRRQAAEEAAAEDDVKGKVDEEEGPETAL